MGKRKRDDDGDTEQSDLSLIYLQTLATPGGLEILADLKRTFYDTSAYGKTQEEVLADGYRRDVIQHIIDKLKAAGKTQAADILFKADCM